MLIFYRYTMSAGYDTIDGGEIGHFIFSNDWYSSGFAIKI